MKKEHIDLFRKLVTICEKNNIGYQVFFGTLIGAIREKGPIDWDYDFDIIMTPESYKKLKKLFPNNCLDSENNTKYPGMLQKFIPDNKKILDKNLFIDIYLLVETTEKRIKRYTSFKNKLGYSLLVFRSRWKPKTFSIGGVLKYLTFPFWFLVRRFTINDVTKKLIKKNSKIYYIINSPLKKTENSIYKNISFETISKPFLDFNVNVPMDFHKILTMEYSDYMTPVEWKDANSIDTLFID